MKKFTKFITFFVLFFVVLIVALSLFLKSYLSDDRLKLLIVPHIEELTGKKLTIGDISVSLFRGILATNLTIFDKEGKTVILKTKKLIISYKPLALLKKQLVISKIEIITPHLSLRRDLKGAYNLADVTTDKPVGSDKVLVDKKGPDIPVSIIADRLLVKDGSVSFIDEKKEFPSLNAAFDITLKGSVGKDRSLNLASGHVSLKEIKTNFEGMDIKATGTVDLDMQTVRSKINVTAGNNSLEVDATVEDYLAVPSVEMNINSRELNLDTLIPSEKQEQSQKEQTKEAKKKGGKKTQKGEKKPPPGLNAVGRITVNKLMYQAYVINNFKASYRYEKGTMKIDPLTFLFSGGDSVKAQGSMEGNISFRYGGTDTIKKSLTGNGKTLLGKGNIGGTALFDAIASLTGIAALNNPGFDNGSFNFEIKNEVAFLDGFVVSDVMRFAPRGTVSFAKRLNLEAELKVAPDLSKGLFTKIPGSEFLKDENGWPVLPLTIRGTIDKPKVSLSRSAVGSILKKGIMKPLHKQLLPIFR